MPTPGSRESDEPTERVEISLFGGFSFRKGKTEIRIHSRKAQALLAFLLLEAGGGVSRERLAGLLWSESDEERARMSLRQILRSLRQVLDEASLATFDIGRSELRVDRRAVEVDATAVAESARSGEVSALLLDRKRLADSLLTGFEDVDPAFRIWLLVQRQSLHDRLVRALEDSLERAQDDGAGIRRTAEALLNLDPTHEEACQHLMRSYAQNGDLAGALRCYKALWDALDSEYDMEPSEATQSLYVKIKSGELAKSEILLPPRQARPAEAHLIEPIAAPAGSGAGSWGGRSRPTLARPALVVEAFSCESVPSDDAHLVHGFRHELIAKLVRFRDWSVIEGLDDPALPLAMADGPVPAVYQIGATFYSGRRAVGLVLTLKERPTGHYIWSDEYELDLPVWFDVQQRIVRRISAALNVHISAERLATISAEPDVSLEIYDRWLRANDLSFQWRPEVRARASEIFRSIIDEAPDFAPAYSSLVQIENSQHLVFPGVRRTRARSEEALNLAKIAVQADPIDSRTQLCLAWSHAMSGRFEPAELHFRMACDLNENDPWTLVSSTLGFAYLGDTETAGRLADLALDLDLVPSRAHWGYQSGVRFLCGDYVSCVSAAERAGDAMYYLPAWKAAALSHLGRDEEAEAEAKRFIRTIRENWHGETEPDDEAITRWLLHCFPIRREDAWQRLREGLLRAGVPVPTSGRELPRVPV